MRLLTFAVSVLGLVASVGATSFSVTNLVSDDQTANAAQITDATLKNAWGMSASPSSPFWVSANGSGLSDLYSVNPTTHVTAKVGLQVSIPGDGSVTGQVFNGVAGAFNGDAFLFVSEDGTISGWRGALGSSAETLAVASSANVYKGAAQASISGNGYLYAANFRTGAIDVLKGSAGAPDLAGRFTDPNLPSGYAPFNVQNLGGTLYVAYALQDIAKHDDVPGAGNGFVSAFDVQGNFLARVGSQGALNSPWGLAIAPASFGEFAGDLLVGNFGDGRISAFDLVNNSLVGQLQGSGAQPLAIDGLWGLMVGNNGSGGSNQELFFSAGPNNESNGLFGVIAVPEPTSAGVLGTGLVAVALLRRRPRSPMLRRS